MRIVTLLENTACSSELAAEHGLSLYIETGEHRILFDAGQTDLFAQNARKLGIDLSRVDLAVLSHGHYDHGGGLAHFLSCNSRAPVYMNHAAFEPHYHGSRRSIGLDPQLRSSDRLIFVGDRQEIAPGITLYSCNDRPVICPIDPSGLTMGTDKGFQDEDFRHEQYLLIREGEKRILLSGCSHKGILNIAHWFSPDVLVGGFHFSGLDPRGEALEKAARTLLSYPTVYYTGHCTGQAQFEAMKAIMGRRLHYIRSGTILDI